MSVQKYTYTYIYIYIERERGPDESIHSLEPGAQERQERRGSKLCTCTFPPELCVCGLEEESKLDAFSLLGFRVQAVGFRV